MSQYTALFHEECYHFILGQIFILFQSRADVMENFRTILFSYLQGEGGLHIISAAEKSLITLPKYDINSLVRFLVTAQSIIS